MKHGRLIAIAGVVALVIAVVAGVEMVQERERDSMRLYVTAFEAMDAETGEKLTVRVTAPGHTRGRPELPVLLEMTPDGPYRITCVDVSAPEFLLRCEGYEPEVLRLDEPSRGVHSMSRRVATRTIRFRRASKVAASDGGTGQ